MPSSIIVACVKDVISIMVAIAARQEGRFDVRIRSCMGRSKREWAAHLR